MYTPYTVMAREEVCKHNVSRGVENIEILLKVKIQNVKNTMASTEKDTWYCTTQDVWEWIYLEHTVDAWILPQDGLHQILA